LKFFLKIFFLLVVFEILLGVGNLYFSSEGTIILGIKVSTITSSLIHLFSMPINIFGRALPFYARESWVAIVLTILNIAIQSFIVLKLYKTLIKPKTKYPKD
jgi:hypothetical protein